MPRGKNYKSQILTAEQILEKRKAEAEGRPWPPANLLHDKVQEATVPLIKAKKEVDISLARTQNKAAKLEAERDILKLEKDQWSPETLRRKLDTLLKQHGVEPAEELVKMALEVWPDNHPAAGQFVCDADQRIKIWCELLSYRMPKLKAMEISGQVDQSLTVIVRKHGEDTVISRDGMRVNQETLDVPMEVVRREVAGE